MYIPPDSPKSQNLRGAQGQGQMGDRGVNQADAQAPRKVPLDFAKAAPSIPVFNRCVDEKQKGALPFNLIIERVNSERTKKELKDISQCYAEPQYKFLLNSLKNTVEYIEKKLKEIPENSPLHKDASTILKDYQEVYNHYNSHAPLQRPQIFSRHQLEGTKEDKDHFTKMEDRLKSEQTQKLKKLIEAQNKAVTTLKTNPQDVESKKILNLSTFESLNAGFLRNVVQELEYHLVRMTPGKTPFIEGNRLLQTAVREYETAVENYQYAVENKLESGYIEKIYNMIPENPFKGWLS